MISFAKELWKNSRFIKKGVIRKDADIRIIKVMLEASIEKMISEDMLEKNNIKYVDALKEVVDILVDGIAVR